MTAKNKKEMFYFNIGDCGNEWFWVVDASWNWPKSSLIGDWTFVACTYGVKSLSSPSKSETGGSDDGIGMGGIIRGLLFVVEG